MTLKSNSLVTHDRNLINVIFLFAIGLTFLLSGCMPIEDKTPKEKLLEWAEKGEISTILDNRDDFSAITELTITNTMAKIDEIPDEIELLENLEKFHFDAVINRISPKIGELKNLKELTLKVYHVEEFPISVTTLKNIDKLTYASNILKTLPKEIGNLSNLKILNLEGCLKLSYLPEEISQLSKLKLLDISSGDFEVFPSPILKLKTLEMLDFSYNDIKEIPEDIGSLKELKAINMDVNMIEEIPESIGNLSKLQLLHVANNYISRLPSSIEKIKYSLKNIKLSGNNFSNQEITRIKELLH